MKLRISERADADIVDGYLYGFLNFGRAQAERYEQELRLAFRTIADYPHIAAERLEYVPPVRIHHHAKHYLVYVVDDDGVLILRVLRDEVDLARHL